MSVQYPDNGHPFEDAGVLRNAVLFTTAQRAFTARLIVDQDWGQADGDTRAFAAVNAFTQQMLASEDILSWILVLREWQPGTVDTSLIRLLDKTQLNDTTEKEAEELLASIDDRSLRQLFHIPPEHQLRNELFPEELIARLESALPANLDGLRRLVRLRREDDRVRVFGYNKIKHLFLAFPENAPDGLRVFIPKLRWMDDSRQALTLGGLRVIASPSAIRLTASRAVIAQAVLSSLLGAILWIRFGQRLDPPRWAIDALNLPGWLEDGAS